MKKKRKNSGRKGRRLGPYGKKKPQAKMVVRVCGAAPLLSAPGAKKKPMTEPDKCPLCGGLAISGFGLAFGGYGPYYVCGRSPDCPWFWKEAQKDDEGAETETRLAPSSSSNVTKCETLDLGNGSVIINDPNAEVLVEDHRRKRKNKRKNKKGGAKRPVGKP